MISLDIFIISILYILRVFSKFLNKTAIQDPKNVGKAVASMTILFEIFDISKSMIYNVKHISHLIACLEDAKKDLDAMIAEGADPEPDSANVKTQAAKVEPTTKSKVEPSAAPDDEDNANLSFKEKILQAYQSLDKKEAVKKVGKLAVGGIISTLPHAKAVTVALELSKVGFKYAKSKKPVLNNVSAKFPKGSKTTVIGKNGSGKSTLLKLILKYLKPTSGEIYLDGVSYDNLSAEEVQSKITYVSQDSVLFNSNVYENIKYGNKNIESKEQLQKIIDKYGLSDFIKNLDQGLETKVGKRGSKLSGGQRQIIYLLRAFLQDRELLLLDEITNAVDKDNKQLIMKILKLFKDKTLILITHDPQLIEMSSRIYNIENGSTTEFNC